MRDFDLRALQLKELEILKEIDRVCKKYDIHYYLGYGTLLGAIRHDGFIPWDDDIDLLMHLEDLAKFKVACEKEYAQSKAYFFQDIDTEENYYLPFAKFRDCNSTYIVNDMKDYPINWGISIDLFPLIPVKQECGTKWDKLMYKIMNLCLNKRLNDYGYGRFNLESQKMKFVPFALSRFVARKVWHHFMKRRFDAPYYMEISCGMNNPTLCLTKAMVSGEMQRNFEGTSFPIMKDYDGVLRHVYGAYMVIPDVDQQIDHGDIFVDLEKNYTNYQA